MLLEILIKRNIILLVNSLFFCYFIIISANLLYMLSRFGFVINIEEKLPEVFKMEIPVSLLSSVNGTASFLFPALISSGLIFILYNKKNKWSWILILNIFITILILWSATSLTGAFLIICYNLFVYRKKLKKINTFILAITTIVISLGITFFNIQYLFSYIYEFSKINSLIQEGYFRSGIMLLLVILSVIVATPFINKYLPILTGNYIPRKYTINHEKK